MNEAILPEVDRFVSRCRLLDRVIHKLACPNLQHPKMSTKSPHGRISEAGAGINTKGYKLDRYRSASSIKLYNTDLCCIISESSPRVSARALNTWKFVGADRQSLL
jgi:hypothetical protein